MNKDAEGRWKVGRSYIKLKMRAKLNPAVQTFYLNNNIPFEGPIPRTEPRV